MSDWLMNLAREKFGVLEERKEEEYIIAPYESVEKACSKFAIEYKKYLSANFMLISGADIASEVDGTDFTVTKKIDGEMRVVYFEEISHTFDDEKEYNIVMSTTTGRTEFDMVQFPCLKQMYQILKNSGLKNVLLACELTCDTPDGKRTRVADVQAALATQEGRETLSLMPFDLLAESKKHIYTTLPSELSTLITETRQLSYPERYKRLCDLFGSSIEPKFDKVRVVQRRDCKDKAELINVFNEWVSDGKAEGIVVRNALSVIYKIKPRHTIDAVLMGFTESDDGNAVRDLLFGVREVDGNYRTFACSGTGLSENEKILLKSRFESKTCPSDYYHTDSRSVAYKMVVPEFIYELSVIELVSENSKNEPLTNMLLRYTESDGYIAIAEVPGCHAHYTVIERERADKTNCIEDVRSAQLTDLCHYKKMNVDELKESKLIKRQVFKKEYGRALMVKKFLLWKTNKDEHPDYPAYVIHFTDFSSRRKEPLRKDVLVSSDYEQINLLYNELLAQRIKTGWQEV